MAWKIPVSKGGLGPIGEAKVKVSVNGTRVGVRFIPDEDKDLPEGTITLNVEDCPKWVRAGRFIVGLNEDLNKMTLIKPIAGMARLRFVRLARNRDDEIILQSVETKWGTHEVFKAVFEITSPDKWAGMQVTKRFRFYFKPFVDGDKTVAGISKNPERSAYAAELLDWLTYSGVLEKPLGWKSQDPVRLLAKIEKRAQTADRELLATFKDGWVEQLYPVEEDEDEGFGNDPEAEFDEEFGDGPVFLDEDGNPLPEDDENPPF
ncbi:hypothetical protein D6833_08265 [Candidatus Parcubacteria bacterium]|nr:MAG: hypothetical protein D6833_08265 [Candidatus Parcubacteria bacterium]